MGTVHIPGDGLVALAAALRLARVGHDVTVVTSSPRWRADAERPLAVSYTHLTLPTSDLV